MLLIVFILCSQISQNNTPKARTFLAALQKKTSQHAVTLTTQHHLACLAPPVLCQMTQRTQASRSRLVKTMPAHLHPTNQDHSHSRLVVATAQPHPLRQAVDSHSAMTVTPRAHQDFLLEEGAHIQHKKAVPRRATVGSLSRLELHPLNRVHHRHQLSVCFNHNHLLAVLVRVMT